MTKKKEAKKRATELLKEIGLEDKAEAYPASLSGGQKQRLALARAFVNAPRILILDDTTSSFDLKTEAQIIKNIYNYSKQKNITTFISSQKTSTLKICDKILVLDKFKVVAFDTPENLSKNSNLYKDLISKQERSF